MTAIGIHASHEQITPSALLTAMSEAHGVQFVSETFDSGVLHPPILVDPAGNVLDLHHRYARRRTVRNGADEAALGH